MTERSFFDFGSQPGDFDHPGSTPWGRRFQDLSHSIDESIVEASFDADELPTHGEIIELIETLHAGESSPFVRRPVTERPHTVQLPEHYEAGYAYPLVVWFHGDGGSEADVASILPNISDRNYVGLALRGNVASEQGGYGWSTTGEHFDQLTEDVESLVLSLRRQCHIHSERIYLAGFGSGATVAMQLMLRKPEWFGGAACLCGSFAGLRVPPLRFHDLQSKRVLLGTSANSRSAPVSDVVATGRLLYSSGMQIGTRVYQDAVTAPSKKMLRDINHWLMDGICSAIPS